MLKRTGPDGISVIQINDDPIDIRQNIDLLNLFLGDYNGINFGIRFRNGSLYAANPPEPLKFIINLRHKGSIRNMLLPPGELTITEAFLFDDFDIEGDIMNVLRAADSMGNFKFRLSTMLQGIKAISKLPKEENLYKSDFHSATTKGMKHSKKRDKNSVSYHYDMSNKFYSLWLDKNMVYSGAYFTSSDVTLEQAQIDKLDYICKKLRLKPEEKMLDIGCGWGALVIHAAANYGVSALGVTLSNEQAEFANSRIKEMGLQNLCEVKVLDYRDITDFESFDKISSVEMLHHVGKNKIPAYFSGIKKLLKPGGVWFNLAITNSADKGKYKGPKFAEKYFMPDYDLVPIGDLLNMAEKEGLEITDVENLREHYKLTALNWLYRLESKHKEVLGVKSEVIYRVWRLSLALMAYGFETRMLNMYHFILNKPTKNNRLPFLTREQFYK